MSPRWGRSSNGTSPIAKGESYSSLIIKVPHCSRQDPVVRGTSTHRHCRTRSWWHVTTVKRRSSEGIMSTCFELEKVVFEREIEEQNFRKWSPGIFLIWRSETVHTIVYPNWGTPTLFAALKSRVNQGLNPKRLPVIFSTEPGLDVWTDVQWTVCSTCRLRALIMVVNLTE